MRIACVGAGYVGGSTMAMMAKNCPGIHVTCIDINEARVAAWNSEELPIHEPGLLPIVQAVRGKQLLFELVNILYIHCSPCPPISPIPLSLYPSISL